MSRLAKVKVGVLRGGPSHGYDISLKTGGHVLAALREMPSKYEPVDIFISRDGEWHKSGIVHEPHLALKNVDVVWNALHSSYGEDGQVQRILEPLNIPFTGPSTLSSVLSMNKELSKNAYLTHSLLTPKHEILRQNGYGENDLIRIFQTFMHPVIVKPSSGSFGLGVRQAGTYMDLKKSVEEILSHSEKVLVEEFIRGKSLSCLTIDRFRDDKIFALCPVEQVETGFVESTNISAEERSEIENMARRAHVGLGMRHYAVSDFILTPKGRVYILETNSVPPFYPDSHVHGVLKDEKIADSDFVDHIVNLAMNR